MIKKLLSKLKRKKAGPHEDPAFFMSRRELIKEVKRLRKRTHEVADEWHIRYGQLLQDLLSKQITLSIYKMHSNDGWEYLKKEASGEVNTHWSPSVKMTVGRMLQELSLLASMNGTKDKLMREGRKAVAKLALEAKENPGPEDEAVLRWLRHTAPYLRPVFGTDSLYGHE